MHGGIDEGARQEEVVEREEADIGQRESGDQRGRYLEAERAGDQESAKQQPGTGENDGGRIQVPGARHGQIAADDQAPQRELEESLD